MSKRKVVTEEISIEMGGPGLDAFNECFGFAKGTTTLTASVPIVDKKNLITKTEIKKQAKEKQEKIKALLLKRLRKVDFPIAVKLQANTLKLSNKEVTGDFAGDYEYYTEYVVECKSPKDVSAKIGGMFVIDCTEANKGDDLLKQRVYGSVNLEYDYITQI